MPGPGSLEQTKAGTRKVAEATAGRTQGLETASGNEELGKTLKPGKMY